MFAQSLKANLAKYAFFNTSTILSLLFPLFSFTYEKQYSKNVLTMEHFEGRKCYVMAEC